MDVADSNHTTEVNVKRIFDPQSENDGFRILVDRLWPRGLKKSEAHVDLWLKDVAPSTELRKWFDHDPDKWDEFIADYTFELKKGKAVNELLDHIKNNEKVTLLYAAKDEEHNNGLALKLFLDKHPPSDQ